MAKKQQTTKQPEPSEVQDRKMEQTLAPKPSVAMTRRGFEPSTIEEAWRFAEALAQSEMVPDRYRGRPRDCLIALDLAGRLGVSWLAIMQNVYSVYGSLGMEAKLCTSLINMSGLFTDPLDYEVMGGDDPFKSDYKIRAFATRKSTGKVLYGPWITWKLIKAEGWDKKNGSKWATMPDVMFHYRAASWFANRHCPEVKMGMMTTDEIQEVGPKHVESTVVEKGVNGLKERLAERDKIQQAEGNDGESGPTDTESQDRQIEEKIVDNEVTTENRSEETQAKINEQKEKLQAAGAGGKKSNLFK